MKLAVTIIFMIVCVILSVVVLMQEGKSGGLGAISGSAESSYWNQIKGRTAEGKLERFTIILAVLFFALAVLLNTGLLK
ncbi:MAG: preprotein translocase subunit SecG [Lachnospiraceae bacterium]|nr:preprotein translocase subunit SecG [Lachnospiraceae bacterium]